MKKLLLLLALALSGTGELFYCEAQSVTPEVIASDGNYFTGLTGSISWTIGEPVSDTYSNTNILTKGFHQPRFLSLNSVPDSGPEGTIFSYPNPVTGNLALDFSTMETGEYSIELFDMVGNLLKRSAIKVNSDFDREKINFSGYAEGLYFLKITNTSNLKTKTIRVIRQK